MRFTIAAVAGLVAVASAATTTASVDPATQSAIDCLDACDAGDVKCQSYCITVPSPNDAQVNATNECVGNCDQGSGSESDTQKYSECVQSCIADNYWKTVDGTPRSTGAAGSGSGSKSSGSGSDSDSTATATAGASGSDSTDASETDSSDSSDSTETGTATGSSASATNSDSAAPALALGSVTFLGFIAAVLAL